MRRPVALLIASLMIAGAVPGLAAESPTAGGVTIRLLDAPVNRKGDPRALLYIVDHVPPGASFTRRVELRNKTAKAVSLLAYPDAADIAAGTFRIAVGKQASELTSWVRVSPDRVTLAPGRAQVVTVKVTVPPSASTGERYGAVVAELPPVPQAGTQIAVASRVAIRMYLDVGAGGEKASDFAVSTLTAKRTADGVPIVTAQVRNTGGRALDLTGRLGLTKGPGGLSAGPFDVQVPTTLGIGQTGEVSVPLDRSIPAGPWTATLGLDSGFVHRRVMAVVTFPSAGAAAPVAAEAVADAKKGSARPLVLGVLGGLGLLGLLLLFFLRRRSGLERMRDQHVESTQR